MEDQALLFEIQNFDEVLVAYLDAAGDMEQLVKHSKLKMDKQSRDCLRGVLVDLVDHNDRAAQIQTMCIGHAVSQGCCRGCRGCRGWRGGDGG